MIIKGKCKKSSRTKDLIGKISPGEIAIINHLDLDEVIAESLIKMRIKGLINIAHSLSGKYPAQGTRNILKAGIPVIDQVDSALMNYANDGNMVEIDGNKVKCLGRIFKGNRLEQDEFEKQLLQTETALNKELEKFTLNTMEFAVKEMREVFAPLKLPQLKVALKGKHVLVVVRGRDYKKDLQAIKPYIKEMKPVLIGVDGGADALIEQGFKPDIVVGDMDSISDKGLKAATQIIVHAYLDGENPGEERVKNLGLNYDILAAIGTSEDVALLMAYQESAELLVVLGSNSSLIDFLNKGRAGMSSTFLVRLKIGSILLDAKGVSKLYKRKIKGRHLMQLVAAALSPLIVLAILHVNTAQTIKLAWLRLMVLFGI